MNDPARRLHAARVRHERALAHADQTRDERDKAILAALAAGMTHRAAAEAAGVTYGRVGQLAAAAKR